MLQSLKGMGFKLSFLGGAGTVTGSRYLIEYKGLRILVDCGLFQGLKSLRLKNWEDIIPNPEKIDAIILTHAHIDHSGFIPRLINTGFRGKVFCHPATRDLCKILLPDSGYLMEEEAEYLNKYKRTKHHPALPLFTEEDGRKAVEYFTPVEFEKVVPLSEEVNFKLTYSGHILGASSVILSINGCKIAFTGDVGRQKDSIFYPPALLPPVDYLVTESTYGNRLHKHIDPLDEIEEAINEVYINKGVIIVPAFAVGRAQTMMYYVSQLKKKNRIPPTLPVYLNSPMATSVTDIFQKYHQLHRLSEHEAQELCDSVTYVRTVEESRALNERSGPMVIISASGMLTGGRVLHHLKSFAPYSRNLILLTGFQAAGTRGEALEHGAEDIKIHGQYVPVRASVKNLSNLSAHADYKELVEWFAQSKIKPRRVFITHGEPSASDELRRRLSENFGWDCKVPEYGESVILEDI